MWSVLLSVDYFGRGGYIISRALMLFSPFFVSWHVLVMRAVLWSSAPIALVIAPIKRFLRGTTGAIFFANFSSHTQLASTIPVPPPHIVCVLSPCLPRFISSSHPISRLPAYGFAFCYPATRISISPRSSPRYPRHGGRGGSVHGYDTAGGWRDVCVLARAMTDGGGTVAMSLLA